MSKPYVMYMSEEFISNNPMSDQAFRLFLLLEGCAERRTYCAPTNESLMELTGKSLRAVRYTINELERDGWIKRVLVKGEKIRRAGFILLKRSGPTAPAATTPQAIAAAEAALSIC